ncbi:MarR family transcriptional regulator (plasmid) [Priestia megaterium]|uniref:Winged helix DNA-binding domain protein n=1 Tax=Priestia megaterium (strain ATCC 14581 / DSM 32 / CCUG 1817 / JCM 2506 / NBRC 15308 / NCIMB 9376 / NCTC 10342 / NRRL B-14308 / VKM B-512 / Ford 19) TaxID=1348623 RepID=A0A0B6AR40_PRIM2|nr:MarR family transcriptional regulator [Priestia megaterium]AJI25876.1 winged helix DNA-binding domain protein [Priestia megaterium NBRC 15308 = ATCC 14581]KFN07618.1 marR family protein [Priestia megaterium]KGJ74154.1 MarR family transcriptional regulator [Priestia megaterium NBRC 15308 = ATCC 14581]MDR4234866.1 MarR family transcriptional regulator [Priestia megaterium]MED3810377.1 MarR family transcriptional regulator [Priestia megaterium]
MTTNPKNELLNNWISITNIQLRIANELERALQKNYDLSLKEFYVLYFLSQSSDKKLRLQQLQEMVGLSQSAMSRLVGRLEAKSCGVLQRHICEDDRRGIYTSLTEKGSEKLQGCLDTVYTILQSAFSKENIHHELQTLLHES